jgi:hypothetical protein
MKSHTILKNSFTSTSLAVTTFFLVSTALFNGCDQQSSNSSSPVTESKAEGNTNNTDANKNKKGDEAAKVVDKVELEPLSLELAAAFLPEGTTIALDTSLQLKEGGNTDLSKIESVTWEIANPAILDLKRDSKGDFRLTSKSSGMTSITFTWGKFKLTKVVSIKARKPVKLSLSTSGFSNTGPKGTKTKLKAEMTFDDGLILNVTNTVNWHSMGASVALGDIEDCSEVDLTSCRIIQFVKEGSSTINVEINSISSNYVNFTTTSVVLSDLQFRCEGPRDEHGVFYQDLLISLWRESARDVS